jgi:integrase
MPTINFFIQGKNNPTGIYVRLRDGSSIDAKARTKFAINPNDWSTTKRYLKHTKDSDMKKLDKGLHDLRSEILTAFNSVSNSTIVSSDWLKSVIDPIKNSEIPLTLVGYFEYYREKQKINLAKSSYSKLSVVMNFLIQFEKAIGKRISIGEINEDFKQKFVEFGLNQGYSQNYLARNLKFIKTVCYDADLRGIRIDPQLRKLKIKENPTSIIFLTPSELEAIENAELKREALINARDWLIISCETAQRVSDFLGYRADHIRYQQNTQGRNIPFLDIIQKKTKTSVAIPLSTKVMKILEKREGSFPRKISDQRYNEYIKEIAKEAGLIIEVFGAKQDTKNKRKVSGYFPKWELVTSHIGRRSFATNNFGKIPTSLIMAMTGHKTEREFLKYVGKAENSMAMQLAEYIN